MHAAKFTIFLKMVKFCAVRANSLMFVYIDNYDSFTYNSVALLQECGAQVVVFRNDQISINELRELSCEALVIGPGPKCPNEAGISMEAIEYFYQKIPVLGLCLGHQCLGQFFGGTIVRAKKPSHGMSVDIHHGQKGIFSEIPAPFKAGLYNSLVVEDSTLEIVARSDQGEVMGLAHAYYPIFGVQFHPESIVSEWGREIFQNFMQLTIARKHGSSYSLSENANKVWPAGV